MHIWRWRNVSKSVSMYSTSSTWGQVSLSGWWQYLAQSVFGQGACTSHQYLHSMSVTALLTQTHTASLLCEVYLCLPYCGSQQVEVLHFWHLSSGFALGGALRTNWRGLWRGGGDPGWCSAPLKWWGCQKRGRGPCTWGHCCIQSLWRCWGSPGAPPAASSLVCSAGWRHASSCGAEGYREEREQTGVNGNWICLVLSKAVMTLSNSNISLSHCIYFWEGTEFGVKKPYFSRVLYL